MWSGGGKFAFQKFILKTPRKRDGNKGNIKKGTTLDISSTTLQFSLFPPDFTFARTDSQFLDVAKAIFQDSRN
jgi:hypothetical protein